MIQVFVSYSRKDTEFADQLETNLRGRNYQVWMDRSSIRGGELWKQSIIQGIDNSIVVCVIVSQNSLESSAVQDEIKIALANSKTTIPIVIIESRDFSGMLKEIGLDNNQAINFASLGFDRAFPKLLDALDYWTFPKLDFAHGNSVSMDYAGKNYQNLFEFSDIGIFSRHPKIRHKISSSGKRTLKSNP